MKNLFLKIKKRINDQSKKFSIILTAIFVIILSLSEAVLIEWVHIGNDSLAIQWILNNTTFFVLSFFVIFLVNSAFFAVFFRPWAVAGVSFPLFMLLPIINEQKIIARGEVLMPFDLFAAKEGLDMAPEYFQMSNKYITLLIIFVLIILASLLIKKIKLSIRARLISSLLIIIISFSASYLTYISDDSLENKHFIVKVWTPVVEYSENGLLNGFVMNIKRMKYEPPEDYDYESVVSAAKLLNISKEDNNVQEIPDEKKPNIIIIMAESFWDVAQCDNIDVYPDPMAKIKKLSQEGYFTTGNALSNALGGGTINPEYEFLTGKSCSFYPIGSFPFQQYLHDPQWALPYYFSDIGYSVKGMHPNTGKFWRRNAVYPLLGFNNCFFNEEITADGVSSFSSDTNFGDYLIKIFEKEPDKPNFIFSITLENHGPYSEEKYSEDTYSIGGDLSSESKSEINTFLTGVDHTSEMFLKITAYFKDVKRPTYVYMFGDHAPGFVSDPSFYKGSSDGTLSYEDNFRIHNLPVICWNNKGENMEPFDTVSMFDLQTMIFNNAGLKLPIYSKINENAMKYTRGFTWDITLDENGDPIKKIPDKTQDIIDAMEILQYDDLYGEKYLTEKYLK